MESDFSSDAMTFGSLVDAMLLDPAELDKFTIKPATYIADRGKDKGLEKSWSGSAIVCKEWMEAAQATGNSIISQDTWSFAESLCSCVKENAKAAELLSKGRKQLAIVWIDEDTGVLCKGRIDNQNTDSLDDLKTTKDASEWSFSRDLYKYGYHQQAAMYLDGWSALKKCKELLWHNIVAENTAPSGCKVYVLQPESIELGRREYKKALRKYAEYLANDPDLLQGYSEEALPIDAPVWALKHFDDKLMDFIDGQYLDNKALPLEGVQLTVKAIKTEEILNPRTFKKVKKRVCYFDEFKWGFVLSAKCNRKKLLDVVGGDSKKIVGAKVTIYQNPTVKYGPDVVGAIRIK